MDYLGLPVDTSVEDVLIMFVDVVGSTISWTEPMT